MKSRNAVLACLLAACLPPTLGGCMVMKSDHDRVVAELNASRKEATQLKEDLSAAKGNLGESQASLSKAKGDLTAAEVAAAKSKESLEQQLRLAMDETGRLQGELDSARKAEVAAEAGAVQAAAKAARLDADLAKAKAGETAARKAADAHAATITDLREKLAAQQKTIDGLNKRIADLEAELKDAKAKTGGVEQPKDLPKAP